MQSVREDEGEREGYVNEETEVKVLQSLLAARWASSFVYGRAEASRWTMRCDL